MLKLTKLNQILIMLIAVSFRYVALFHSSTFLNYFLLLILCLLTFYNLLTIKFSSHKFRTITILLLLSIIVFFLNNEDNLFIYLITALAFLEVEDKQLIKLFLTLSIFCFITIIVAGQVGIIDIVTSGRYINEETIYRNSLGFGNVNTPFIYFLGIVFCFYYLFKSSKLKLFIIYLFLTIIALWIFNETDCRTGFYIYILFIIASLIYNNKINNWIRPFLPSTFLLFTIFSLLLAIFFGQSFHNPVNSLLSSRPYFSYFYIKNHLLLSLTGTGVVGRYVIDNYFLSLLIKTGLVGYLTYNYLFMKGSKTIQEDYRLVLIMLFTLAYGISECNLYGNFIYILLLKSILNNKEVKSHVQN